MRSEAELRYEIWLHGETIRVAEESGLTEVAELTEATRRALQWATGETVPGYGDTMPSPASKAVQ